MLITSIFWYVHCRCMHAWILRWMICISLIRGRDFDSHRLRKLKQQWLWHIRYRFRNSLNSNREFNLHSTEIIGGRAHYLADVAGLFKWKMIPDKVEQNKTNFFRWSDQVSLSTPYTQNSIPAERIIMSLDKHECIEALHKNTLSAFKIQI